MLTGTRASMLPLVLASGLTGAGAIAFGLVGVSEAAFFGAGGALVLMLLRGASAHQLDALYPARIQLARFRRSGEPADILVVGLPAGFSMPGRRLTRDCALAVSSLLRVTDGVSPVPSLGGNGLCAVLESDGSTRSAIDRRLRSACGDEIQLAWATSPEDGVTLDSLLEVALNRLPDPESGRLQGHRPRPLPVRLLPRALAHGRGARSVH